MLGPETWRVDERSSLGDRITRILAAMERHRGASCAACGVAVCGHHVVFGLVAGEERTSRCLACLAAFVGRPAGSLRDELVAFVASKPCLSVGWRQANLHERVAVMPPPCLAVPDPEDPGRADPVADEDPQITPGPAPSWDAGDLGCGELVLELRRRLAALPPGASFQLTATDAGAPEDIPAWCRLTGHRLEDMDHPHYRIRRRS